MPDSKQTYQSLYEQQIFIGGEKDVAQFIDKEAVDIIIDLRAEVEHGNEEQPDGITRVHIPLVDRLAGQEALLKKAIDGVVEGVGQGKKVAIHCAAGRSRTGSVAVGVLLALGLSDSVKDAESKVRGIRPEVEVHSELRKSLASLYEN
ncbi:protein-tyrosine phosphatase family protein [Paenibacillus agricola]|uniref:Protein tyrosine phosphatase n=1 Tax=Paenibacillus agricola TaxID=2716264 RepID=A0ABX0J2S0_9BACL|nr:dual specificity protein phosphatase family protein [Paenibacillus agricola]NHN30620.1 protein tyrosine phosphatase [Paenibacillus agricola]